MKTCTICKVSKNESDFYIRKERKSRLTSACKNCRNKADYTKRKKNPEYVIKQKEIVRQWGLANKDKRLAAVKRYQKKHPAKVNAQTAIYQASKLKATPPWTTPEMKRDMVFFYAIRENMLNPDNWNIDHYYPLRGKEAKGLHVPWNLRLYPAKANVSKHNYMPEPLPLGR